jgi:hypothetical protein
VAVALYSVAILGFTGTAVLSADGANWSYVLVLAVLFLLAEHRDRVFTDETGLSGSIAVALAAAFLMASEEWVGGAFLCGMAGGLYLPHLRQHAFAKVVVNSASFGMSAIAAASAVVLMKSIDQSALVLVAALFVATAVYWVVNSALLALATSGLSGERFRDHASQIVRSDTVMLVFGLGGAMCGVVMSEVGVWTGVAALVALLVALDVFVISVPAGLTAIRAAWTIVLARGAAGGVAGALSAVVTRAWSMSALGAVVGLVSGVLAGIAVAVLVVGARLLLGRRRFDPAVVGGLVLVELPYPVIAAVTGVVVSLAGLSIGLVVASALVVAGSVAVAIRRRHAAREPQIDDDTLTAAVVEAMLDGLPSSTRDR